MNALPDHVEPPVDPTEIQKIKETGMTRLLESTMSMGYICHAAFNNIHARRFVMRGAIYNAYNIHRCDDIKVLKDKIRAHISRVHKTGPTSAEL